MSIEIKKAVLSSAAVAAALAVAQPALAGKANDTLVYASDSEPESVSPYHNNVREGVILARNAWDTLLWRDPGSGEYVPLLATSWEWVDDKTLDVELRQGVTFHNGEPFDADDVVFTFNYVVTPEAKVVTKQNVEWIESAEKLGPYKVRIHTKGPFPAALEYLSGPTPIYPNEYFEKVGLEGYSKAPVGTGPYKITRVDVGKGVSLEKFDGYFKDSPRGEASIGKLEFRVIPDAETRVAELMTGGVDWIWRVPADQADQLEQMPNVEVLNAETMRVAYLAMDAAGRTAEDSPFKDIRVRRAVAHAIDRQAIVDNLVRGASRVMHAACFPSQFGCDMEAVKKYEYDPAKAKELLAEAGYKDGFKTDIYAYREREYTEAMMGYLRDVGIDANLHFLKYAALRDLQRAGKVPLNSQTWGSFSVNDVSAFTGVYFKGGPDDYAMDAEVTELLEKGDVTTDPAKRKELYREALQKIAEQAYWLPLFSYSTNYAFTSDLSFEAQPDEVVRFYMASWK
ncbi:ABC transporter substrate-binding protein [Geminicoccaceae bacterium 1502E]|nr:ABC transporter substrate-binding protein [Geminicoccaceae bacterium 1502E]